MITFSLRSREGPLWHALKDPVGVTLRGACAPIHSGSAPTASLLHVPEAGLPGVGCIAPGSRGPIAICRLFLGAISVSPYHERGCIDGLHSEDPDFTTGVHGDT